LLNGLPELLPTSFGKKFFGLGTFFFRFVLKSEKEMILIIKILFHQQ
jgi:hypothetical protein